MEVTVGSLAQMLMDGHPGETVLAALRSKYKQGSSQLTNIYKEHTCRTCGKPMKGHPRTCPER